MARLGARLRCHRPAARWRILAGPPRTFEGLISAIGCAERLIGAGASFDIAAIGRRGRRNRGDGRGMLRSGGGWGRYNGGGHGGGRKRGFRGGRQSPAGGRSVGLSRWRRRIFCYGRWVAIRVVDRLVRLRRIGLFRRHNLRRIRIYRVGRNRTGGFAFGVCLCGRRIHSGRNLHRRPGVRFRFGQPVKLEQNAGNRDEDDCNVSKERHRFIRATPRACSPTQGLQDWFRLNRFHCAGTQSQQRRAPCHGSRDEIFSVLRGAP